MVTKKDFTNDLSQNYAGMQKAGINKENAGFFIPPYEWYNDSIAAWTTEFGVQLINYTPGTKSTSDYTYPELKNYRGSDEIYNSIIDHEQKNVTGLNGFILLLHIGTDPRRTDKFYQKLPQLVKYLRAKGYQFQTVNQLLKPD